MKFAVSMCAGGTPRLAQNGAPANHAAVCTSEKRSVENTVMTAIQPATGAQALTVRGRPAAAAAGR
jgi:hypothetical protein